MSIERPDDFDSPPLVVTERRIPSDPIAPWFDRAHKAEAALAAALVREKALLDREQRMGRIVGILFMGAAQSDREMIAEAAVSLKVTFPDGAPFAQLRDAALAQPQEGA